MSAIRDQVEFWIGDRCAYLVDSSHAPQVGEIVSIAKINYVVRSRNFAVDYHDNLSQRRIRLAVNLELAP